MLMWPSQLSFSSLARTLNREGSKLVRVASCVALALIQSLPVHPVTVPKIPVGKPRRFPTFLYGRIRNVLVDKVKVLVIISAVGSSGATPGIHRVIKPPQFQP